MISDNRLLPSLVVTDVYLAIDMEHSHADLAKHGTDLIRLAKIRNDKKPRRCKEGEIRSLQKGSYNYKSNWRGK